MFLWPRLEALRICDPPFWPREDCGDGLAGCNTVVTLHFFKVLSPSEPSRGFFFPGSWEAVSRSASAPQNETKGLQGKVGGKGGIEGCTGAPGFFYYHGLDERRGSVTLCRRLRLRYTIVKRWRGQDERVGAFILTGNLWMMSQIFNADQD